MFSIKSEFSQIKEAQCLQSLYLQCWEDWSCPGWVSEAVRMRRMRGWLQGRSLMRLAGGWPGWAASWAAAKPGWPATGRTWSAAPGSAGAGSREAGGRTWSRGVATSSQSWILLPSLSSGPATWWPTLNIALLPRANGLQICVVCWPVGNLIVDQVSALSSAEQFKLLHE